MNSNNSQKQIVSLLQELKLKNERLNTTQLLILLEHIKYLCINKTAINLIISSVRSLANKELLNADKLTERESEIVLLIAEGLQNIEIASRLNLSRSTIETHRKNIRKKLQLKGNGSLFAFALVYSIQSYQIIGG
ncbi:MAG: DNA-binding response regulator [Winogradskyella sp.]|uniref:response regulator transcription factor n=1 Tax=Winogradskyella sp. TaxID=1883156 RepID=UPI000F3E5A61|nr:LuxR C-terminal-related transcriptional regulator [Winogradskyella sp.]RNC86751.1 MAG: DNA-binding response regulator [Winogradskyella sp.]